MIWLKITSISVLRKWKKVERTAWNLISFEKNPHTQFICHCLISVTSSSPAAQRYLLFWRHHNLLCIYRNQICFHGIVSVRGISFAFTIINIMVWTVLKCISHTPWSEHSCCVAQTQTNLYIFTIRCVRANRKSNNFNWLIKLLCITLNFSTDSVFRSPFFSTNIVSCLSLCFQLNKKRKDDKKIQCIRIDFGRRHI